MKKITVLFLVLSLLISVIPCALAADGGESVLMDEDFSGNNIGTVAVSNGNSSVTVEGGALCVNTARSSNAYGSVATMWGDISWQDYTIETRVKTEGTGSTDMFSIVFRYQYPARSHSVGWLREKRQFFIGRDYLSDYSGWAFDNLFFDEPEGYDPTAWNNIKIEVKGARIIFFVNNQQIFDWTAEQNPSMWGKVGVAAETRDYGSFKCRFDNLKVSGTVKESEDTSFTGLFLTGTKLMNESFFTSDNWTLSQGFSVEKNENGNYLAVNGTGSESRAWANNIDFDNCAADLYVKLQSGKISAFMRYVADNLYYECIIDSSDGGSIELLKHYNNALISLGRVENLSVNYGVELSEGNWIRVRTQQDWLGVFYGPMKQTLLKVQDEGTGLLNGKFALSVTNGNAEISDVIMNRAATSVVPPEMQPTMPISKANMLDSDETGPEYARIYVSADGDDTNDGTSTAAPFRTIARALEYVGVINDTMTGNIVVEIAQGEYNLSESLVITPENSGKNGYYVIFDAPNGATVQSGGEVSGWEQYDGNIWRARPDLSNTHEGFREFYLNGLRKQRACQWFTDMPDLDFYDDPSTAYAPDGIFLQRLSA